MKDIGKIQTPDLRRPYLSKKRNINVSVTVMTTPPHRGIAPFDSSENAMAVPITSFSMGIYFVLKLTVKKA